MWREWKTTICGAALILRQHIPKTDRAIRIYIDCIPFCKHYIYDGDSLFCELGHVSLKRCSDIVPTGFTVKDALGQKHVTLPRRNLT